MQRGGEFWSFVNAHLPLPHTQQTALSGRHVLHCSPRAAGSTHPNCTSWLGLVRGWNLPAWESWDRTSYHRLRLRPKFAAKVPSIFFFHGLPHFHQIHLQWSRPRLAAPQSDLVSKREALSRCRVLPSVLVLLAGIFVIQQSGIKMQVAFASLMAS
jgi:hypothetical protein